MNKGIRSLIGADKFPDEIQEEQKAKAEIARRLGVPSLDLQAARTEEVKPDLTNLTFKPDFFTNVKSKKQLEDEKYKRDFERDYGDAAIKKDVLKKVNANKRAGKEAYEGMSTSAIIIAEHEPSIQQQVINYSPNKIKPIVKGPTKNQKNFRGLKGGITVDADHPDGFRINDDKDLYDVFGKDTSRYIQELTYKYDGTPIKETVKKFDSMDRSTFPSDPKQQAALRSYGRAYDRLTPLQKKQIDNNKKKTKLFENILPLKK